MFAGQATTAACRLAVATDSPTRRRRGLYRFVPLVTQQCINAQIRTDPPSDPRHRMLRPAHDSAAHSRADSNGANSADSQSTVQYSDILPHVRQPQAHQFIIIISIIIIIIITPSSSHTHHHTPRIFSTICPSHPESVVKKCVCPLCSHTNVSTIQDNLRVPTVRHRYNATESLPVDALCTRNGPRWLLAVDTSDVSTHTLVGPLYALHTSRQPPLCRSTARSFASAVSSQSLSSVRAMLHSMCHSVCTDDCERP
jgi:hypothetical protein